MIEEWRPIAGHEDHYEVSNLGRVRSIPNRILKPKENNRGYLYVVLCYGPRRKLYIHRLVAAAFLPNTNRNDDSVVNHIDFNPHNNRVDNLEWITQKGNMHHSIRAGRFDRTESWLGHLRAYNEENGRPVIGTNVFTGDEVTFKCLNDCRDAGFQPSCVCNCCQGKRKSHKGYTWRYADG